MRIGVRASDARDFLYGYVVLCVGCYSAYRGAPVVVVLAISALLILPDVWRRQMGHCEFAARLVVAVVFAALAHAVGWGVEWALVG